MVWLRRPVTCTNTSHKQCTTQRDSTAAPGVVPDRSGADHYHAERRARHNETNPHSDLRVAQGLRSHRSPCCCCAPSHMRPGGLPMTIQAINPTTGETINTYEEMAPAKVAQSIAQAHDAFLSWRQTSMAERAQRMHQAAKLLREQAPAYATLMAQEMGKPVKDGRAEAEKC